MSVLASMTIPGGPWLWPALAALPAALLLVVWSYRRSRPMSAVLHGCFWLEVTGLVLLTLCLLEPLYSGRRAEKGANLLAVLADNSATMNVRDVGAERSRGDILADTVTGDSARWLAEAAENFQLRRYIFDSRIRRTTDFSQLTFDGRGSALGSALKTIADRYHDKPLAGVVVMTDGGATDLDDESQSLPTDVPVYAVPIGGRRAVRDLSLTNVSVTQTSFEDAPVTIQADIQAAGFAGRNVVVTVIDDDGSEVETRKWPVKKDEEKQAFRFRLRPEKSGVLFYRVSARDGSPGEPNAPAGLDEATDLNNERTVVVDRGRGPYRVLYVTGRPNWEYKFLRRALVDDDQIKLVGLIRVARREPKYDWRGRTGEQSNPLYRGFGGQDDERVQQYDQPVLVRLDTRDEAELADGFPKTADKLFCYHAVIVDDVDRRFFTQDQMDLLRRFVSERGGGFMMLGGGESFREGDFDRTGIGSILPVYLDRVPQTPAGTDMRFALSREGWLEPWVRLRDNENDELRRLDEMPGFKVLNRIGAIKAGARVVATIGDAADPFPALVVHRYGNGRAAALTIGDVWRWGLREPELREDMEKFWRQAVRWLVADVPAAIGMQALSRNDLPNQPVEFKVATRGDDFEPLDNVSVVIEVREPDGQTVQLRAETSLEQPGLFEAGYVPRTGGGYLARAIVRDSEGIEVGDAEAGWTADLQQREFASLNTNRALLEKLARDSGGRLVEAAELEEFATELPYRDAPITSVWVRPLWDLPGVLPALFLLIVACFAAEWLLRRWKQLP